MDSYGAPQADPIGAAAGDSYGAPQADPIGAAAGDSYGAPQASPVSSPVNNAWSSGGAADSYRAAKVLPPPTSSVQGKRNVGLNF